MAPFLTNSKLVAHWCRRTCSVVYSHAVSPVSASVSHDDSSAAKMEWDRATSTQASVSSSSRKARVGCEAHGFQCTRIGAKGQAATNRNRRTVHTFFLLPIRSDGFGFGFGFVPCGLWKAVGLFGGKRRGPRGAVEEGGAGSGGGYGGGGGGGRRTTCIENKENIDEGSTDVEYFRWRNKQ